MGMIYVNGSLFIPGSSRELSDILSPSAHCLDFVMVYFTAYRISYLRPPLQVRDYIRYFFLAQKPWMDPLNDEDKGESLL